MTTRLIEILKKDCLRFHNEQLEAIDKKVYWHDKLKNWKMEGYLEDSSPVDKFEVRLSHWATATDISIYVKKDYPFVKAVHLIIDDLVDYMNIDPEKLHSYEQDTSVRFVYPDFVEIWIYMHSNGSCRPIYKEENKIERKIVGYECG